MKTIKFEKRLKFKKEIVSKLTNVKMNQINGGLLASGHASCKDWTC